VRRAEWLGCLARKALAQGVAAVGVAEGEGKDGDGALRVLTRLGVARPGQGALEKGVALLAEAAEVDAGSMGRAVAALAKGPCGEPPACGECGAKELCRAANRGPTIKEMPEDQRPRERLMQNGPAALTDAELLGIIIRDGSARESAVDLGRRLLARFGGLRGLAERRVVELCAAEGIGPAKASQVMAALALARRLGEETLKKGVALNGSRLVFEHFFPRLRGEKHERFIAVLLDTKNRVIRDVEVSMGGLANSLALPRDVFRYAVTEPASAVIFVHNHPSGDPTPSQDDLALTKRLSEAGDILGIRVLDHVIVGEEGFVSLADRGRMR